MDTIRKPVQIAFERFSSSVLGYYNLWAYLDETIQRIISGHHTHTIKSCLDFYCGIAEGRIKHGDRILLQNCFISEWVPRSAGGLAHLVRNGTLTEEQYYSLSTEYNPDAPLLKTGDMLPPFGSIRFPLEKNRAVILSAVTADEFHVDYGIVLSVTDSVYAEFLSRQKANFAVEATLEGHIDLSVAGEGMPSDPSLPKTEQTILSMPLLSCPKFLVRVLSPVQVKFRYHNSHPHFNAWFIRRREYKEPLRVGFSINPKKKGKSAINWILGDPIEYEYFHFPVLENDPDELSMVREIMDKQFNGLTVEGFHDHEPEAVKSEIYKILSWSMNDEDYTPDKYGILDVSSLTEFDGRLSQVDPLISFRVDPRALPMTSTRYLSEIVERELGNEPSGNAQQNASADADKPRR